MAKEKLLLVERKPDALVVRVPSRRLFLETAEAFREELLHLARETDVDIIVDLSAVNVMNSSALGALILASDMLSKRGKRLVLTSPGPVLRQVLTRMKLDTILTIVPSVEEAFAMFSDHAETE